MSAWHSGSLENIPDNGPITSTRAWLKVSASAGGEPVILCNNEVVLPFHQQKKGFLTILEGLGADTRSSAGAILDSTQKLPTLKCSDLPEGIDLIDLRRFPADQAESILPESPHRIVRDDDSCYALSLPEKCDSLSKILKKKLKQNLRTSQNRIRRDHGDDAFNYKIHRVTQSNWTDMIELGRKVAAFSWQGKSGVSVFLTPDRLAWLKQMLLEGFVQRAFTMTIKDKLVAITWFIELFPDTLFYLVEFDQEEKKYGPGHLTLNYGNEFYLKNGFRHIDFGYGEADYKKNWCDWHMPLVRVLIPISLRGHMAVAYQRTRWLAGKVFKRN